MGTKEQGYILDALKIFRELDDNLPIDYENILRNRLLEMVSKNYKRPYVNLARRMYELTKYPGGLKNGEI